MTFSDVEVIVGRESVIKRSRLDRGYKLFHEKFIFNYEVSNVVELNLAVCARCCRSLKKNEEPHSLQMTIHTVDAANLSGYGCSCAAGRGMCNHVVALLYQTAHYSTMGIASVPLPLASTSMPQAWHKPRTQGIVPEAIDQLVIKKPKQSGSSGVKSTLYMPYKGWWIRTVNLLSMNQNIIEVHVLQLTMKIPEMTGQFGPVPFSSPLSYKCPPVSSAQEICHHPDAPQFPDLPLTGYRLPLCLSFVPMLHQSFHLDCLAVNGLSATLEQETRGQSRCPLWSMARESRLTASRFHEVLHARGEESMQRLAIRILKGTRQTAAMRRGLELEPEVLRSYGEVAHVNVYASGFVVHPDAPHLGASPDGRVVDPTEFPPFGLVEVKCPNVRTIFEGTHIKAVGGKPQLKRGHKYWTQVQGQLAVTGLRWCDFVTDTAGDLTVEMIWHDDALITAMKEQLDLFYFNIFMDQYFKKQ
ncbi:hypothetical protein ACEWY4_006222 [Coilia grayii]|uniref:SWIM-type domain-containing protein n=1 Tax=Coilia grayii TaxID=363190 RepID=A0ABD1KCU1_9TELE